MMIRYMVLSMLLWHGGICAFNWFKHDRAAYAAQQESWDEAKSLLKELVRDNPDDPTMLYDAGVSSYKLGEIAQARGYFEQAAASPKADSTLKEQSFFNVGNTHMKDEAYDKAIEAYENALKINPDNERTKHNKKIAEEKKRQQEQQDKQDQNKKNDQNKDDKKDQQNKDQNKDDQDKQNQENEQNKQDQNKDNQDKQDQKKDQGQDNKQDQKPDQGQDDKDKGDQDRGDQDKQQKDQGKDKQDKQKGSEKDKQDSGRPERDEGKKR